MHSKPTTLRFVVDAISVEGQGEMGGIDPHGDRALVSDGKLESLEIPTGHIDVVLQLNDRSYGLVTHTILKKAGGSVHRDNAKAIKTRGSQALTIT